MDLQQLKHRGPDAQAEWTSPDGHIWLGHTRLAIVDLSPTGAQPMHDPETGNVIIFNGEIYNHARLREEMRDADVKWSGTSDTETLLVAYRLWGERMVKRLKGMFAFTIYDAATKRLFVARGPLGIKPLYYVRSPGTIRFASEVRVLLDGMEAVYDKRGIGAYLQWGACPENEFLFRRIRTVPAGHWMSVQPDASVQTECYWPEKAYPAVSPAEAPVCVRTLVEHAVESHLMADVPVASFLSGGIDSSIVTALASRAMSGRRLQTFSIGFTHAEFDETSVAAEVARRYNTDHHRIEVTDDEAIALVQEAVHTMNAPSLDAINTFIVSKKSRATRDQGRALGIGRGRTFRRVSEFPRRADSARHLRGAAMAPSSLLSLRQLRRAHRGFADGEHDGDRHLAAQAVERRDAAARGPAGASAAVPAAAGVVRRLCKNKLGRDDGVYAADAAARFRPDEHGRLARIARAVSRFGTRRVRAQPPAAREEAIRRHEGPARRGLPRSAPGAGL